MNPYAPTIIRIPAEYGRIGRVEIAAAVLCLDSAEIESSWIFSSLLADFWTIDRIPPLDSKSFWCLLWKYVLPSEDLIAALPPGRHHSPVALRAFSLLVQINFYCLHLREKDSKIAHPYIMLVICKRLEKKNGGKSRSIFWRLKKLAWSTHAHPAAAAPGS